MVDPLIEDEHTAGTGPPDELVGGDEDRVQGGVPVIGRIDWRIHVDGNVGRARGIVETCDGVVFVKKSRDLVDRRPHSCDVGGCGKGSDPQSIPILGKPQQLLEVIEVDTPVGREPGIENRGEPLSPGHFVGVVLEGSHEDDRLMLFERRLNLVIPAESSSCPRAIIRACRVAGGRVVPTICCSFSIAPEDPVPHATMRPSGPALTEALIARSACCNKRVMVRPVMSSSVWVFA